MDPKERLKAFGNDLLELVLNSLFILAAIYVGFLVEHAIKSITGSDVPKSIQDAFSIGGFVIFAVWILGDIAKLAWKHLRGR